VSIERIDIPTDFSRSSDDWASYKHRQAISSFLVSSKGGKVRLSDTSLKLTRVNINTAVHKLYNTLFGIVLNESY